MEKRFSKMFDDFDINIQCEELEDYFNYNDRFEDPRYLDEEDWYGAMVKWSKTPPFHGGNTGSNPVGVTKEKQKFLLAKQMCGYFETLNETLRGYHGFVS